MTRVRSCAYGFCTDSGGSAHSWYWNRGSTI